MHSLEISATLLLLFYDNIMMTSANGLVQRFYTYWQICDNQAVVIISLKNNLIFFLRKNFTRPNFFLDSGEPIKTNVSYTHSQPKSSYNHF
jgi:hypothetical protein